MVRRGRKPSCTAWRVTENAPEITAWEAITVATVASTTIGSCAQSGISRKNGLSIAFGSCEDQRALAHVVERSAPGRRAKNQARRIGERPKWPMSAYSASAPVTVEHDRAERDERDVAVLEQELRPP